MTKFWIGCLFCVLVSAPLKLKATENDYRPSDSCLDPITAHGAILGTPGYRAPVQAPGKTDLIDERTDVFGMGAVFYEVLKGRAPFHATSSEESTRLSAACEFDRGKPADVPS
jgi:serine/threonine protein kinase